MPLLTVAAKYDLHLILVQINVIQVQIVLRVHIV